MQNALKINSNIFLINRHRKHTKTEYLNWVKHFSIFFSWSSKHLICYAFPNFTFFFNFEFKSENHTKLLLNCFFLCWNILIEWRSFSKYLYLTFKLDWQIATDVRLQIAPSTVFDAILKIYLHRPSSVCQFFSISFPLKWHRRNQLRSLVSEKILKNSIKYY